MPNRSAVLLLLLSSCVARAGLQAGGGAPPPPHAAPAGEPSAESYGEPAPDSPRGPSGGDPAEAWPPGRWTLAEREHWQAAQAKALQYVNLMNEVCGTTIELQFAHEELRPLMTSRRLHDRAQSFASDVPSILRNLCLAGAMEKQAVQSIRTIVIGRPADARHRLDGGTLVGAVDETANPRSYYYAFEAFVKGAL